MGHPVQVLLSTQKKVTTPLCRCLCRWDSWRSRCSLGHLLSNHSLLHGLYHPHHPLDIDASLMLLQLLPHGLQNAKNEVRGGKYWRTLSASKLRKIDFILFINFTKPLFPLFSVKQAPGIKLIVLLFKTMQHNQYTPHKTSLSYLP